jgi:hypothetical protein
LTGKKVFALALDGELKIGKIAKGYAAIAYNDQLTVKIEGVALKDEPAYIIISQIVESSFRHGYELEIAQINKVTTEIKAYLIATTPEQKQKLLLHQVSCAGEMIMPTLIAQQRWTRKEISKKNCLTLIVKNLNVTYMLSKVHEALQKLLGERNVICTYFPKDSIERNMHDGVCNLEMLNPAVYKQYLHRTIKLFHTYVKFIPHPRSLDGTSPPTEEMLKEFGFSEINTAIANTLTAIANIPTTQPAPEAVTMEQVTHLIQETKVELKGNLKQDVEQMKDEIIQETETYTDIVTEQLKESLDTKFEELMGLLSGTRNLLKNSTARPALGPTQGN